MSLSTRVEHCSVRIPVHLPCHPPVYCNVQLPVFYPSFSTYIPSVFLPVNPQSFTFACQSSDQQDNISVRWPVRKTALLSKVPIHLPFLLPQNKLPIHVHVHPPVLSLLNRASVCMPCFPSLPVFHIDQPAASPTFVQYTLYISISLFCYISASLPSSVQSPNF
jgi:hypothetical protein